MQTLTIDRRYLILAVIALALVAGAAFAAGGWWYGGGPELPLQTIGNTFLDVNGDGLVDYIFRAEVLLNPAGPLSGKPSQ